MAESPTEVELSDRNVYLLVFEVGGGITDFELIVLLAEMLLSFEPKVAAPLVADGNSCSEKKVEVGDLEKYVDRIRKADPTRQVTRQLIITVPAKTCNKEYIISRVKQGGRLANFS